MWCSEVFLLSPHRPLFVSEVDFEAGCPSRQPSDSSVFVRLDLDSLMVLFMFLHLHHTGPAPLIMAFLRALKQSSLLKKNKITSGADRFLSLHHTCQSVDLEGKGVPWRPSRVKCCQPLRACISPVFLIRAEAEA